MFLTAVDFGACRGTVRNALDLHKAGREPSLQESKVLRTLFKSKI